MLNSTWSRSTQSQCLQQLLKQTNKQTNQLRPLSPDFIEWHDWNHIEGPFTSGRIRGLALLNFRVDHHSSKVPQNNYLAGFRNKTSKGFILWAPSPVSFTWLLCIFQISRSRSPSPIRCGLPSKWKGLDGFLIPFLTLSHMQQNECFTSRGTSLTSTSHLHFRALPLMVP